MVLQENNVDDYWTVDDERPLSGSLIGFKRFTVLK